MKMDIKPSLPYSHELAEYQQPRREEEMELEMSKMIVATILQLMIFGFVGWTTWLWRRDHKIVMKKMQEAVDQSTMDAHKQLLELRAIKTLMEKQLPH